jgi:hypothetical protein
MIDRRSASIEGGPCIDCTGFRTAWGCPFSASRYLRSGLAPRFESSRAYSSKSQNCNGLYHPANGLLSDGAVHSNTQVGPRSSSPFK